MTSWKKSYTEDCPYCREKVDRTHYTKSGWCPERRMDLDKNGC